jgi:hypothetical protein
MQLEATDTTDKATLGAPVVAGLMPTATTRLRGMSRVHRDHRTTALFCLVREKGFELGERPAMQASLGRRFARGFCPLADSGEVFEDYSATRRDALGKLFGQDVVTVAPESGLRVSETAQVPPGTFGPPLLQRPFEPEVAPLGRFPGFLAQKLVGRGDRRVCQAQVNANDLVCRSDSGRGNSHYHMQPPAAVLASEQVGGIHLGAQRIWWRRQAR